MIIDVYAERRKGNYDLRKRAWLDGEEVMDRCIYVDTDLGLVRLYKHNARGRVYVDPDTRSLAVEERRGTVVLEDLV